MFVSISSQERPFDSSGCITSRLSLVCGNVAASAFAFSAFLHFRYKKQSNARVVAFCFSLMDICCAFRMGDSGFLEGVPFIIHFKKILVECVFLFV